MCEESITVTGTIRPNIGGPEGPPYIGARWIGTKRVYFIYGEGAGDLVREGLERMKARGGV